jgi:hypothetical protein
MHFVIVSDHFWWVFSSALATLRRLGMTHQIFAFNYFFEALAQR